MRMIFKIIRDLISAALIGGLAGLAWYSNAYSKPRIVWFVTSLGFFFYLYLATAIGKAHDKLQKIESRLAELEHLDHCNLPPRLNVGDD